MPIRVSKLILALLLIGSNCFAGSIEVLNETRKELKIKILAEGNTSNEKLVTYIKNIPAESCYNLAVDTKDLKNSSHFSEPFYIFQNLFTAGDRCEHLSVEKDYKITFLMTR